MANFSDADERTSELSTFAVPNGTARMSSSSFRPVWDIAPGQSPGNLATGDLMNERRDDEVGGGTAQGRLTEAARNEAEQVRRLAEAAREARDHHRETLEIIRQEREQLRETAETARAVGEEARTAAESARALSEEARVVTDAARDAVVDAVRATADTMSASLEQMKVVEDMRRILREMKDVKTLDSN